jgi:hypothetical protein
MAITITTDNASHDNHFNKLSIRSQFFETQRRILLFKAATRSIAAAGLAHDILQGHLNVLDLVFRSAMDISSSLSNEAYQLLGEIIHANDSGGPTEVVNTLERLASRFSVSPH